MTAEGADKPAIQTGGWRKIGRALALWLAGFGAIYIVLQAVHARFPYLQSGAELVAGLKHELAREGTPFALDDRLKVMAFGHSKMLTGLIPELFDRELDAAGVGPVQSYNFGLPGELRFVEDLERLAARGHAPDIALLIIPWPAEEDSGNGPTVFKFLSDDRALMDRLFPFRKLLRDLFILAGEARGSPGRMREIYRESERTVRGVAEDRGYYFIARQSHYPNDELPVDFTMPTDRPGDIELRIAQPRGPIFERLATLHREHGTRFLLIPSYYRQGQFAPPPPPPSTPPRLEGHAGFGIVGPDYFVYPNRLFSDPTHLNPHGAEIYTREVASLVSAWLRAHPAARGAMERKP